MSNNFIQEIQLENYKSIKKLDIKLTNLNILIGANGAGKSNFIGIFSLLKNILDGTANNYITKKGGIDAFLTFGRKHSDYLKCIMCTENFNYKFDITATESNDIMLSYSFGNGLFSQNSLSWQNELEPKDREIVKQFNEIQVYHLHDTGDTSPMKKIVTDNDNLFLRSDGENVPGILRLMYNKHHQHYRLIVNTIRMIMPDFLDFVIRDDEYIQLEWRNKFNPDIPLKAHYLSDGSLRFIALATLLLMPLELQPEVIIIDEPELGLHPFAISILSDLIMQASQHRQIIISTQSVLLLENFSPENIIVVDKVNGLSEFKHLEEKNLALWLEDYNVAELWQRGIIGGQP